MNKDEEISRLAAECERLRGEVSDLHTTMMAAAVEIQEHWAAHCDAEGYGPANLMHRLEQGIAAMYGYNAQTVVQLERQRDAALAELAALKGGKEAVAEVSAETFSSDGTSDIITCNLPIGTKLYLAPPAQVSAWVAELSPFAAFADALGLKFHHPDELWDGAMALHKKLTAAPTPGASDGKGGE